MKNRIQIVYASDLPCILNFTTEEQTKEVFKGLQKAATEKATGAFSVADVTINMANFQWMSIVEGVMGDDLSQLIADYMNLIQACGDLYPNFSKMLDRHHGDTLETHVNGINQFLAGKDYTPEEIARFWSGEDQLTSS